MERIHIVLFWWSNINRKRQKKPKAVAHPPSSGLKHLFKKEHHLKSLATKHLSPMEQRVL